MSWTLGWLEYRIHGPDDAHGQDYVGVLAALDEVRQGTSSMSRITRHLSSRLFIARWLHEP